MYYGGVFDAEIYVEFQGKKEGSFYPASGPVPLHTYRPFKKTHQEKKLEELGKLAKRVSLPRSVLSGQEESVALQLLTEGGLFSEEKMPFIAFKENDSAELSYFKSPLEAKLAIVSFLGRPLATLENAQRQQLDVYVNQTLHKETLLSKIKDYFHPCLYQSTGE